MPTSILALIVPLSDGGLYPGNALPGGAPGHPSQLPIYHPGHPDHGLPSAPGHPSQRLPPTEREATRGGGGQ